MATAPRTGMRDVLIDRLTSAARWLPKGRTTAHRVIWRALGAPPRFVGRVDGQYFCVDARDTDISTTIYLWQEWEPPSSAIWMALLAPGQVVVDIGANKGWFSMLAAKRVLSAGRVISYEPLPRNVADLEGTIAANGYPHWAVRAVAASDHAGNAQLLSPRDDAGTGWGSLETKAGLVTESIDVPVVELAADLAALGVEQVDLLKMDIEGHEQAALTGLLPMLRTGQVKNLLVEIHRSYLGDDRVSALMEMMSECGYQTRLLDESAMSESGWRDAFRGRPDSTLLERLVSVSGPADPAVRGQRHFKLLWSRAATAP